MSTETTNKKIKIDNGTTFGRTYTDKAVDELLKNIGGSGGGISVIELTDKNGTIASTQLGEINANPQNFAFKYNGKILPFTKADSTTYQYCNNTTNSSDNNVATTSTLLTITSSTGVYTIAEDVHNVVANSIHPVNGGDLTNIQVGSKVYSIPSGDGGLACQQINASSPNLSIRSRSYKAGDILHLITSYISTAGYEGKTTGVIPIVYTSVVRESLLCMFAYADVEDNNNRFNAHFILYCFKDITITSDINLYMSFVRYYIHS